MSESKQVGAVGGAHCRQGGVGRLGDKLSGAPGFQDTRAMREGPCAEVTAGPVGARPDRRSCFLNWTNRTCLSGCLAFPSLLLSLWAEELCRVPPAGFPDEPPQAPAHGAVKEDSCCSDYPIFIEPLLRAECHHRGSGCSGQSKRRRALPSGCFSQKLGDSTQQAEDRSKLEMNVCETKTQGSGRRGMGVCVLGLGFILAATATELSAKGGVAHLVLGEEGSGKRE